MTSSETKLNSNQEDGEFLDATQDIVPDKAKALKQPTNETTSTNSYEPVDNQQTSENTSKYTEKTVLPTNNSSSDKELVEASTSDNNGSTKSAAKINTELCIEQLVDGLVDLYVPQLHLFEYTLHELVSDQQSLMAALDRELETQEYTNLKQQVQQTMEKVPLYNQKIVTIEKQTKLIQTKLVRLRKRAEKLAQQREKRELDRLEQKRKEIEREKQLEAKIATPTK